MTSRRGRLREDAGSGSILGVALIAAMVGTALLVAPMCAVLVAKASVSDAADATALAAADARIGISTGFPCEVALRVAVANGTALANCRLDGFVATVSVQRRVLGFQVDATATAGPPR